ncbi:MAG TPA: hypothetical protein EYP04_01105 [Anaerolineae bacterium]|nr:hypothetical protein [Anaerolineae bacterium]
MSLNVTHNQLQQAWQQLRRQWQETAALWNDPVRWQFEQEFWQPLERQVPATLQEMDRLAQVMAQARQNVR